MAARQKASTPERRVITADHVAQMLRNAGAPEPWVRPDLCHYGAGKLTWLLQMKRTAEWIPDEIGPLERAQNAIETLRQHLPHVIGIYSMPPGPDDAGADPALIAVRDDFVARLRNLQGALLDVAPSPPKRQDRLAGTVSTHARDAFGIYAMIVGEASISRNGPACRFVRSCLSALGDANHKTLATIEQELRRAVHPDQREAFRR